MNDSRSAAGASSRTVSMNRLTSAARAPAVSVCGMISSEISMTVAFWCGVNTRGVHAAALSAA